MTPDHMYVKKPTRASILKGNLETRQSRTSKKFFFSAVCMCVRGNFMNGSSEGGVHLSTVDHVDIIINYTPLVEKHVIMKIQNVCYI